MSDLTGPKVVQLLEQPPHGTYCGCTMVLYDDGAVFEKLMLRDAQWEPMLLPVRAPVTPPPVRSRNGVPPAKRGRLAEYERGQIDGLEGASTIITEGLAYADRQGSEVVPAVRAALEQTAALIQAHAAAERRGRP